MGFKTLADSGELTQDQHYSLLTRMCAANLRFIPIQATDLSVGQSEACRKRRSPCRDSAAGCHAPIRGCRLLQADALHKQLEVPPDQNMGEIQFVLGLNHALAESLQRLWANEEASEETTVQLVLDWLLSGIDLDDLGSLTVISWRKPATKVISRQAKSCRIDQ